MRKLAGVLTCRWLRSWRWPSASSPSAGLADRGLFSEGEGVGEAVLAQTGRGATRLGMAPFAIGAEQGRQLLLALEQRIVLADAYPGMLADDLSGYFFVRSSGHIGSLIALVNRGCLRAQRNGTELLPVACSTRSKDDAVAEQARRELEYAFSSGRSATRPRRAGVAR
ncbi:hypothetical protein ABT025_30515 [Streptomyces sp. NPDC002809]|uniref:hypothetical protein n=1 Tax=Streptomyces sp. NPDC002809 TaxID=3154433 RepID=UPI00331CEF12